MKKEAFEEQFEEQIRGECAGPGHVSESAIAIRGGHYVNGSGKDAFGGAGEWPYLQLTVSFKEHDYATRRKWLTEIKKLIAKMALVCACVNAQGGTLVCEQSGLRPQGFTGTVQIFASNDLKLWQPKYEVAANQSVPLNKAKPLEFYRARQKPSPALISVSSALQTTGCLYTLSGTSTILLTDLQYGTNKGHVTAHTLEGIEWEFPARRFPLGSNGVALLLRDVNNNAMVVPFSFTVLPGPAVTIEHPIPGSYVAGENGVLIGRVDDLNAVVKVNGAIIPVCEDGHFYALNLPVAQSNTWTATCGANTASVTFYKSSVTLTYSLSTSSSPHMPLPFIVNGTVSDTNVVLRIGDKLVKPDIRGNWFYRGNPPRKGILPITVEPPGAKTTTSAIVVPSSAQYYITAHSIFHRYELTTDIAAQEYWKQFSGALSKGDVSYHLLKYEHEELCVDDFSGYWPYLWMDSSEGPCNPAPWRIYPAQAEVAQYSDAMESDSLIHSASCAIHFYTGGNPGGNRILDIVLHLTATKVWRDGCCGDEMMGNTTADIAPVGYIGGQPINSDGNVYISAYEGTYVDATPTLTAMNNAWVQFELDWAIRERPL